MASTTNPLIIIFYRNPVLGSVKTRLAATVGDTRALEIFNTLATYTRDVVQTVPVSKVVFYSDVIEREDLWSDSVFQKETQRGTDLGERMRNAFQWGFEEGYGNICIIGTDCLAITGEILTSAFDSLTHADAVIGPAHDGGYYLFGMQSLHPEVFRNKQWGTGSVFNDTLRDLDFLGLSYTTLPVLRDIDTADDLPEPWQ